MTDIELLTRQTKDVYKFTNRLIESTPFDTWNIMPDTIKSTLSWQVGHLIVSHYFHSIWVIKGHQTDILQTMPFKTYGELFTTASPKESTDRFKPHDLLEHLQIVQQKSIAVLSSLSSKELENPLEPTPIPHPIAKTKFEAIDWNLNHTMYHCGQIGILRRIVYKRFDFGLIF